MSRRHYKLTDFLTKKPVLEKKEAVTLINSMKLEIAYDYNKISRVLTRRFLSRQPHDIFRYSALFPVRYPRKELSLNEGWTPFLRGTKLARELMLENLYFKCENANPTGSFKDRGSLVEVAKALEYGSKGIVLASTGNMAASVSAYCAKAGLLCYVLVPENTPETKLIQTLFYGGRVIKVKGSYDQAAKLAREIAQSGNFYLAGDYAFRVEGQKTQAFEIIEQLDFQVPDVILTPVGNGTNIYAIWKGFVEFHLMGLIKKMPKMVAVQSTAYNSIVTGKIISSRSQTTAATAIAVREPSDADRVFDLLKQSMGYAVDVTDEEIFRAQLELARKESLFVEPSSASVIGGLRKIIKKYPLKRSQIIVAILTGTGFKDPFSNMKGTDEIPVVDDNLDKVREVIKEHKWQK